MGAPALGVAGNPLLPALPEEPILSIQVKQLELFPPTINPVYSSTESSIVNPQLVMFESIQYPAFHYLYDIPSAWDWKIFWITYQTSITFFSPLFNLYLCYNWSLLRKTIFTLVLKISQSLVERAYYLTPLMNHQHASRQLYLGLRPKSNRFGIIPCLSVDANCKIMPLYMFGYNSNNQLLIKVSLPQHLVHPVEKWGRPADIVTRKRGSEFQKLDIN